ncbi:MAG TPA: hypothetical protein ENI92_02480 [Bacteroidetes bacterium]|nr:hypothetical protein [Bacteroidota bacterium]
MAKGKTFAAKLAKGKGASKRVNEKGEEITTVRVLKPMEVPGKPGVFRYRAVMTDVTPSMEKELFGD